VRGERRTIFALIFAAPLPANAASLPIDGSYGNDLGCDLARTGSYNPVDGVYLLTPNDLSTAVTLCSFDEVTTAPGDRHHVSMTCASEGSGPEDNSQDKVEISGNNAAGYTVHFADGSSWGPLKKC
jgi:hypothetical protein